MNLGMTGNRNGLSEECKQALLEFLNTNTPEEVHHGDCVGADKDFHDICVSRRIRVIIHPPLDDKNRAFCKGDESRDPKPHLERNRAIVDETDMMIAFPPTQEELLRSGTWATIRYAKKTKKRLFIVFPDGKLKIETT